MSWSSIAVLKIVTVLSIGSLICGDARADEAADRVAAGKKATVLVEIKTEKGTVNGSAFCIDAAEGIFITNDHVASTAKGNEKILLVLNGSLKNQRKVYASLVKTDPNVDLAILKVQNPTELTSLEIGDDSALIETAPLIAFGYPLGTELAMRPGQYPSISVNTGHVSALRRDGSRLTYIQLDAMVNLGNSGGPVLNEKGQVVGVIASGIPGAGINFAIPISKVVAMVRKAEMVLTPNILPPGMDNDPEEEEKVATTTTKTQKVALPTRPALAKAEEMIKTLYESDLKLATTPDARKKIAQNMVSYGGKLKDDPAGRFAVLQKGRLLAIETGDLKLALEAAGSTSKFFKVDGTSLESELLIAIAPKLFKPEDHALLASRGMTAIDHFLKAEQYEKVAPLAAVVQSAAIKCRNKVVKAQAAARTEFAQSVCEEFKKVKPSIDVLRSNPKSPEANAAVGRFKCIYRGEWTSGLPLMSQGSFSAEDLPLKDLAARDLKSPEGGPEQLQLAAAWWDLGDKQTDAVVKGRLQNRAVYWYRKALPNLAGLERTLAEKRLATYAGSKANLLESGEEQHVVDLMKIVDPVRDATASSWSLEKGNLRGASGPSTALRFPYRPGEEYDFLIEFSEEPANWGTAILLTKGGRTIEFNFSGINEGSRLGFSNYSKRDLAILPVKGVGMQVGRRFTARFEVRNDAFRAFVDGKLVGNGKPDYEAFAVRPWHVGDKDTVGFVSFWNTVTIYRAEITEVTGAGTPTNTPPSRK